MTLRSRVMLSSLIPAVLGLFATPAQAQPTGLSLSRAEPFVAAIHSARGRVLDAYYSHYSFDAPASRIGMNGVGARLMWSSERPDSGTTTLRSRFAFGLFGEYAPNQQNRSFSVGHAGVQGDMNVLKAPLYGRVAPLVSLGAGVLWANRVGPAVDESKFTLGDRSLAMFALAPSLGTRVALWRELGLRADARDVVTFHDGTLHHEQIAAGLSFPF